MVTEHDSYCTAACMICLPISCVLTQFESKKMSREKNPGISHKYLLSISESSISESMCASHLLISSQFYQAVSCKLCRWIYVELRSQFNWETTKICKSTSLFPWCARPLRLSIFLIASMPLLALCQYYFSLFKSIHYKTLVGDNRIKWHGLSASSFVRRYFIYLSSSWHWQ